MKYDKLVVLGDSLVEWTTKYPTGILQQLESAYNRKLDIVPRGYSGYSTTTIRLAWPQIAESSGTEKIRAFVVFIGSNDAADPGTPQNVPLEETVENVRWIVSTLKELTPNVLLVLPGLMQGHNLPRQEKYAKSYAEAMGKAALETGARVINVREIFGEGNFHYLLDGLHFTDEGYQKIGAEILAALKEAGVDPVQMKMHLPPYDELLGKSEAEMKAILERSS